MYIKKNDDIANKINHYIIGKNNFVNNYFIYI